MKKKQIKGTLLLLLAAIIWGSAFVAQSVGMRKNIDRRDCTHSVHYTFKSWKSKEKDDEFREKKINDRGNLLWNCACNRKYTSTIWNYVHNSRKSRLHHSLLYCHCPDYRTLSEKEMQSLYMGSRCHGTGRTLSSLHHRRIFHWPRRYSGAGMCFSLFPAHSGD